MKILFKNIKELVQVRDTKISVIKGKDMKTLPIIKNAFLLIENGIISDYGKMEDAPSDTDKKIIDATGRIVMPTWIDSHTHLVYAGNREDEFVDRIKGLSYEEIANKGGGILNSAKRLQETSFDALYQQSKVRLEEVIALGTGAIEIKSGYGLTKEAELKMLRVIRKLKENYPIEIKATFLGAHAVPTKFKENKQAYLDLVVNEILPEVAKDNLAEFMDVFCETGYFSVADTAFLLKEAKKYGLQAKIHVNQFTAIGGVEVAVKYNALSVDHLEVLTDYDIKILKKSKTIPVALPSCSFFLSIPYTPARKLLDNNIPMALATDYNPGSTPSGNMNFVVATACIKMKMTPEEAINAATINAAYAMHVSDKLGSITRGKQANLIVTKPIYSYTSIPYHFGMNKVESVFISGKKFIKNAI